MQEGTEQTEGSTAKLRPKPGEQCSETGAKEQQSLVHITTLTLTWSCNKMGTPKSPTIYTTRNKSQTPSHAIHDLHE